MPIKSFLRPNLNFDKYPALKGIDDLVARLPEIMVNSTNMSSFPIVNYKDSDGKCISLSYKNSCDYTLSFNTARKTYIQTRIEPTFSVKPVWPDTTAKVEECMRSKMFIIQDIPRTDKSRADNGRFSPPKIVRLNPFTLETGLVFQNDKLEGSVKLYWWSYFHKVINPLIGYLSFVDKNGFNEHKAREKSYTLR